MNIFLSTFLGFIQGLTEFLPVSSSGHLVLVQKLIPGFSQPGVLFDVILHFGTLAAVSWFFRKKLLSLKPRYIIMLLVGTIPAVMAGLLFRKQLEEMFANPRFLGFEFLITAFINFAVDMPVQRKSALNYVNSVLIGIAQAIAIIPAISRSGATIFAGVKLGITKKEAAEYSFILSIPAILGANVLEIFSYGGNLEPRMLSFYLPGFIASFIVGIISIKLVMKFLYESKFKIFGYYSLIVGVLLILLS